MPREWYDRHSAAKIEDPERREMYLRLLADRKPYFMRYIYPELAARYNAYIRDTNKKCLREFRMTVGELLDKEESSLSEEERTFLFYYRKKMPVGTNPCVMNRICQKIEERFDGCLSKDPPPAEFDYTILKSGAEYTRAQYSAIRALYSQYVLRLGEFMQFSDRVRMDEEERADRRMMMIREFREECRRACPNAAQLCDIVLDLCYSKNNTKQFCWDMCADEIIRNLLVRRGGIIRYPVADEAGDIRYGEQNFSFVSREVDTEWQSY